MQRPSYVLGVDLGTSHSALSYWRKGEDDISILEIAQISAPGQLWKNSILPSVVYLPHDGEVAASDIACPWDPQPKKPWYVSGKWAKDRGGQVPDRCISSAKSWLCHHLVDRREKILPWGSSIEPKLAPVEAMTLFLQHLLNAFLYEKKSEELRPGDLDLTLTVPASFDELARKLTHAAAEEAGFASITLLEEPQAAFYSWIARNEKSWRKIIAPGELVLVCDVGGGTTDFSLIAVGEQEGNLQLKRLSVGEHLLLGGDNMDLSLAHLLKTKLQQQGHKVDRWQFAALVSGARQGKEDLLNNEGLAETVVSIAGKGSSLMASSLSVTLTRQELIEHILEGFFPLSELSDHPKKHESFGFLELGLAYEGDPAISRHLAKFLHNSWENCQANPEFQEFFQGQKHSSDLEVMLPSAVLFNGGVFKSKILRDRVMSLLGKWHSGQALKQIEGGYLDLAVAHGAGYYGRSKASGDGIRIASGIARSYYVGLESAGMAVPGFGPEVKGFCVAAQGTQEGTDIELPQLPFGLVTGEQVSFRFFSSAKRSGDKAGCFVEDAPECLEETARLQVELSQDDDGKGSLVPVTLGAKISEVGTLQLSMQHLHSDKKWDLEFNVRPQY